VEGLNVGSTVPGLFLLHHAALLAAALMLNMQNIPSWAMDGPYWLSAAAKVLLPVSALKGWGVDTDRSTSEDKMLWIFHGHADAVYAAAIRASLSAPPGATVIDLMKWSFTAWISVIAVFQALRRDLAREFKLNAFLQVVLTSMGALVASRLLLRS
jgi:hypothetical protein